MRTYYLLKKYQNKGKHLTYKGPLVTIEISQDHSKDVNYSTPRNQENSALTFGIENLPYEKVIREANQSIPL